MPLDLILRPYLLTILTQGSASEMDLKFADWGHFECLISCHLAENLNM